MRTFSKIRPREKSLKKACPESPNIEIENVYLSGVRREIFSDVFPILSDPREWLDVPRRGGGGGHGAVTYSTIEARGVLALIQERT